MTVEGVIGFLMFVAAAGAMGYFIWKKEQAKNAKGTGTQTKK